MATRTLISPDNVWPQDYGDDNTGDDSITGSNARDWIFGGDNNDTLDGAQGGDIIWGGLGEDSILGASGDDYLTGGDQADTINGGADDDTIFGEAGADTLNGDNGEDVIFGGAAADTIDGGSAADKIYGDAGDDSITGGSGGDVILGGAGKDFMTGGTDGDSFVYRTIQDSSLTRFDVITGFAANDIIDLSPIDASATLANNNPFIAIAFAAGPPAGLGEGQLHYDNVALLLYGNTTADMTPDFRIQVGFPGLTAADVTL